MLLVTSINCHKLIKLLLHSQYNWEDRIFFKNPKKSRGFFVNLPRIIHFIDVIGNVIRITRILVPGSTLLNHVFLLSSWPTNWVPGHQNSYVPEWLRSLWGIGKASSHFGARYNRWVCTWVLLKKSTHIFPWTNEQMTNYKLAFLNK